MDWFKKQIFGGSSDILSCLAQLMLGMLVFPLLCFLLALLNVKFGDEIMGYLSIVPISTPWQSALQNHYGQEFTYMLPLNLFKDGILLGWKHLLPVAVATLCVTGTQKLGLMMKLKGIPVLQTVIGVFLACLLVKHVPMNLKDSFTLIVIGLLLLVNIILVVATSKIKPGKMILAMLLGFVCDCLVTIFAFAYVVLLVMIMVGGFSDLAATAWLIVALFIPMTIFMLVDYAFNK